MKSWHQNLTHVLSCMCLQGRHKIACGCALWIIILPHHSWAWSEQQSYCTPSCCVACGQACMAQFTAHRFQGKVCESMAGSCTSFQRHNCLGQWKTCASTLWSWMFGSECQLLPVMNWTAAHVTVGQVSVVSHWVSTPSFRPEKMNCASVQTIVCSFFLLIT